MSALPLSTPNFQFQDVSQCLNILDLQIERYEGGGGNPYITFAMGDHGFLDVENSGEKLLIKSIVEYDETSRIAIFKMETTIHTVAGTSFAREFETWTSQFPGLKLVPTSTSSVRGQSGLKKRPDCSWKPAILPYNREAKWPSVVVIIEVKWTERRTKFEQDMRFWLGESQGQVKTALSISVSPRGEISIEKWAIKFEKNMIPFTLQKMTIAREPAPNGDRITGQLTIPFEDVFLKQKEPGQVDFNLSHSQLEGIADHVWIVQFTGVGKQS